MTSRAGVGTGVRGTVPLPARPSKLRIAPISAAVKPLRSGVAASVDAVASTFSRSAAEVAVVTRWPSTTKCSSASVSPGASSSVLT